ncbi:MAG: P1 family peptidase [Chloroflexota bacterium]
MHRNVTDVAGVTAGHATDLNALTGCTVILTPRGAVGGVDVRGSAPGTRETDLMRPGNLVERVHAVLMTGGSAFGLAAADGVMRYLEERDIGYDTGAARVPIVPAAVLYDLQIGDRRTRPTAEMGYEACRAAASGPLAEGNVGAGTGATVGKLLGPQYCMKSGFGSWSIRNDSGITVAAAVAVNAFGDVRDHVSGKLLAGTLNPMTGKFLDTADHIKKGIDWADHSQLNTTLAVIITDCQLSKEGANKVAAMAHDGLARSINPIHTMYDGDTVFALSYGNLPGDVSIVGAIAAEVLAEAVKRAVLAATGVAGIRAARDLQ